MQSKSAFLISHIGYDMYLNRMADGLTKDLFAALRFSKKEDAEQWMCGIYAPEDKEDYEIIAVQITIAKLEVEEDVQQEREHHRTGQSIS